MSFSCVCVAGGDVDEDFAITYMRTVFDVCYDVKVLVQACVVYRNASLQMVACRQSQFLPPCARACSNLVTLTFRALGRDHIVCQYHLRPLQ